MNMNAGVALAQVEFWPSWVSSWGQANWNKFKAKIEDDNKDNIKGKFRDILKDILKDNFKDNFKTIFKDKTMSMITLRKSICGRKYSRKNYKAPYD